MLKTFLLLISYIFIFGKYIKVGVFKKGKGETFVGYVLLKIKFINFLKLYLKFAPRDFILVTGTNGKTSTTALLKHILTSSGYTILTNSSGSNLSRGLLSSLVLSFPNLLKNKYSYTLFEVDEAVVPSLLKLIPCNYNSLNIILLNLSRDQLDRYGEVDILASNINKALQVIKNYNLLVSESGYPELFESKINVSTFDNVLYTNLNKKLCLKDHYLQENLKFITKLISVQNIHIKTTKLKSFTQVSGRGKSIVYQNTNVTTYLTKNPVSFNANLINIKSVPCKEVAIYVNDYIPDGRDVSWFYDIDYSLIKSVLKNKNVYVLGSRSFDFYNFLKLLDIKSFNFICFKDLLNYHTSINTKNLVILSNYSATIQAINFLESRHG